MRLLITPFLVLLLMLSMTATLAEAQVYKLRKSSECEALNPEMSEWFQKSYKQAPSDRSEAPIENRIGPIKNQKVGWCFAYAAADMLSEASGYNISGAHVAKNYYNKRRFAWFKDKKESGVVSDALELNLETPLCDEDHFSSNELSNLDLAEKRNCTQPVTSLNHFKVKSFKASGYYDGSTLFADLDEILTEGRIAGIHYDSSQLYKDRKFTGYEKVNADHASTIVARYFDREDRACRYIIRNTFGKTCKKINTTKTKCVDGYYSVKEEQLNSMLLEVVSLKSGR